MTAPYASGEGWAVYCGDAFDVLADLEPYTAAAVITDPPYLNTGSGSSRVSRVAGIPDERQFYELWMRSLWSAFERVLTPAGALWMTVDWRGALACEAAACGSSLTFGGTGVWDRGGLGMGHMIRHTYECFVVARRPEWRRIVTDAPDVWRVKWTPADRLSGHEAEKPGTLMVKAINLLGPPEGGTILDPFAGSGTTGVAALLEGRRFVGVEREERYCAIAARRCEQAAAQLALPGVA